LATYQEERVCQVSVEKDQPADPTTSALAAIENLSNDNSNDDSDKLVSGVGDQIQELRLARDAQEITSKLKEEDLDDNDDKTDCGRLSEEFWLKLVVQSGD
jgi:hypothetical protein